MNKRIKALKKINKMIFSSVFLEPTNATIDIVDSKVTIDINGDFRILKINFRGNVFLYNKLPDGYQIRITGNTIYIYNLLGKSLSKNRLFDFSGKLDIRKAEIKSFTGNKFFCSLNDIDANILINHSKTNLEDDTLLLFEEYESDEIVNTLRRNKVDDASIRGLNTERSFADGYSGKYHYNTDKKLFATGSRLNNTSKPISKLGNFNQANIIENNLNNLAQIQLEQLKRENLVNVRQERKVEQFEKEEIELAQKDVVPEVRENIKEGVAIVSAQSSTIERKKEGDY